MGGIPNSVTKWLGGRLSRPAPGPVAHPVRIVARNGFVNSDLSAGNAVSPTPIEESPDEGKEDAAPESAPSVLDALQKEFRAKVAAADRLSPEDAKAVISGVLDGMSYEADPAKGEVRYSLGGELIFVDHGQELLMAESIRDEERAILGAALLARQKFGNAFELTGSEEFQRAAIGVLIKYDLDVRLKNPIQDAMRRSMVEAQEKERLADQGAATAPGPLAPDGIREGIPRAATPAVDVVVPMEAPGALEKPGPEAVAPAGDVIEAQAAVAAPKKSRTKVKAGPAKVPKSGSSPPPATGKAARPEPEKKEPAVPTQMKAVSAYEWWGLQRLIVVEGSPNARDAAIQLDKLGAAPAKDEVFWFDAQGKPSKSPWDADRYLDTLRVPSDEGSSLVDCKEWIMSEEGRPPLVVRGVRRQDDGSYDTTLLLYKGSGDFLQGFVKANGEKRQVVAHINARKPDGDGVIRPNFLALSERQGDGPNAKWKEIGYGNALNQRKDSKPVYFDEILFSVGNETVSGRLTERVTEALHKQLGFVHDRVERPSKATRNEQAPASADGAKTPAPSEKPAAAPSDVAAADRTAVRDGSSATAKQDGAAGQAATESSEAKRPRRASRSRAALA